MIGVLKTLRLEKPFFYTGKELRPHYLLTEHQVEGSAIVALKGGCHVVTEHLVDYEDSLQNDFIKAKDMVHFLGEFFGTPIFEAVLIQRLFMAICLEVLVEIAPGFKFYRIGDDLFWDGKKLSVSIVTVSPVSSLLHAAINIDSTGAPVRAAGLNDLGVHSDRFISLILEKLESEILSAQKACTKVRPV